MLTWSDFPVLASSTAKAAGGTVAWVAAAGVLVAQNVPNAPSGRTLADWTPWLVGGGLVWLLGKMGDWAAQTRTKWLKADDGTDHKRYMDCEEDRKRDRETIMRLQADVKSGQDAIAAAIVLHASKDRQIDALNDQVTKQSGMIAEGVDRYGKLVNLYAALSERVSRTNTTLAKAVSPSTPPLPIEVKIDPHGEPVPVREVGHADDPDPDSETGEHATIPPQGGG